MYVYIIYRIWNFSENKMSNCKEYVKTRGYTDYKKCKNALLDYLTKYTFRNDYIVDIIESGDYNQEQLQKMEQKEIVPGYGIFDLIFTKGYKNKTRYLINRYRIETEDNNNEKKQTF